MANSRQPAICVFCGAVIGPDEPTSGRPPMAAHAACADAALADDRHWDAVAGAAPGSEPDDEAETNTSRGRSSGCLTIAAVLTTAVTALLILVG